MVGLRQTLVYKQFRQFVLIGKKCENCQTVNGLEIHHIKSVKKCPDLIYEMENIKILCKDCHRQEHSKRKIKQNKRIWD